MGKSKKEANKDYYCKKLDEFSVTRSPITKSAWGWQEYEGNDQSDAGERTDRHSCFPSSNASVFWSNKKAMGWDRGFLTYFTSGDPGKTTGLKLSQEKENQQYKLDMWAEWRTPLILYLWATYYILQNICQFISHSICLEVCITGYNLNANNGRMLYLYYLFNFPQEDSPSTFFRGLSLYISNLTN